MRKMKNIFLRISTVRTGVCPYIDAMLLDVLEDVFAWCANDTFFCENDLSQAGAHGGGGGRGEGVL